MAKKKQTTTVTTPQQDAQDFPKYFKNGTRFTRIDSKTKFIEVQLLQSCTSIKSGSNMHIVMEAVTNDTTTDRQSFDAAFVNAMAKIQVTKSN